MNPTPSLRAALAWLRHPVVVGRSPRSAPHLRSAPPAQECGRTSPVALGLLAAGLAVLGAGMASAASDFQQYRSSGSSPQFTVDTPKWQSKKSGSPFNVLSSTRPDRQCFFDLDSSDGPLDQYQRFLQKYMKDQGAAIIAANPLAYEFKSKDGKYNFVARTHGMDCAGRSYLATVTCLRENFDQATADRVFGSMQCGGKDVKAQQPAQPAQPAQAPATSAAGGNKAAAVAPAAKAAVANGLGLNLRFERIKPGVSFRAIVTNIGSSGEVLSDGVPAISSSRGVVSGVTRNDDGSFTAVVDPDAAGTGEYRVTATLGSMSTSKTAIVLKSVGDHWGQPQAVEGLVNTPGWEDSIYVTPDGQWLFLAYSPVSITCSWKQDHARSADFCEHASGPWSGPARPGFIGAERISANGTVANKCLGVKPSFPLPPFTTYGFRRQPDGSFAQPFVIGVANSGGCIVPGGINVYPRADGSAQMLYTWNEYWDPKRAGNVYAIAQIPVLGSDFMLGTWEGTYQAGGTVKNYRGTTLQIPGSRKHFGHNAHGVMDAKGQIHDVFFDDENGGRNIYVTTLAAGGKYPDGPWSTPTMIAKPVSSGQETMPFFDGRRLTVRRDHGIATADFNDGSGAAVSDSRKWSGYNVDLWPDPAAWNTQGAIYTLGEPTRTDPAVAVDGRETLYFNYAVREADGSTNLNVGFVPAGN